MLALWKRNLVVCWFGSFATTAGMSLVIPFLPLYIQQLGIHNIEAVEQWSGVVFASTFLLSAIVSPVWGKLADLHGRKIMLLRASVGMAIVMTMLGFAQNVYELLGLRLLMGAISGYIPSAITLIATQTPTEQLGWALGTLSTGAVAGSLIGPLIGGWLAELIGLRHVFYVTGVFLFLAFLVALFFIREDFVRLDTARLSNAEVWKMVSNPKVIVAMFVTTFILQLANMSIEPIVTVYVSQLMHNASHIALISGLVVSASGFGNVLAASRLGKLSDSVGPRRVLLVCLVAAAAVFIPQAFVQNPWQLMGLRFLLGIAAAGLLPSINSLLKHNIPASISGRIFGYNQSAQYMGNIAGPLLGGQMAAAISIHYVFFSTSALLLINAYLVYRTRKMQLSQSPSASIEG